jgi:hypothetical protein
MGEEFVSHDASIFEIDPAIGHPGRRFRIVGDEQDRLPVLAVNAREQVQDVARGV